MKLDLDMAIVSRFLRGLLGEFQQKKLWPVAAVLLAAIVAVPVLLSSSSSPAPVAQAPLPVAPPPSAPSLPVISVQSTPGTSHMRGPAHNPFSQSATSGGSTPTSSTTSTPVTTGGTGSTPTLSPSTTPGSAGSGSTPSSGSGSTVTGAAGTTPSVTPPSITGTAKPKPAPTGLSSTQSYDVALAITNSSGGVDSVDPLPRLTLIPSAQQPLLVELGVLQGKNQVLFAVQPGTVVNGPGSCTPGPIDCEILTLGQDQTESVSSRDSGANALFAITGITAVNHSSAAAANVARGMASAAGETVLDSSPLPALSLFKYEPSVGSVVDLRNLGVN